MKPIGLHTINNEAYLHHYRLADLAQTYQTPLYVMDEAQIRKAIQEFKIYFKSEAFDTTVVYASKAFFTKEFARLIAEEGLYMDAVSLGDLYVAQKANFPFERLVFHGNNKSVEELDFAISNQVGCIVVDNLYELKLLNQMLNNYQRQMSILIRVNPGIDAHTHEYIQTAQFTSKFGESIFDEKRINELVEVCQTSQWIELIGFHAHIGSQIHEPEAFVEEIKKMVDFQNCVSKKYQLDLPVLNLGGGFGIRYQQEEKNVPIPEMMKTLIRSLEDAIQINHSTIKKVMIEPGRAIVGPAGITLYKASQVKTTFGKKNYLFIDGGMTDNIRPALYHAIYECDIANKMNNPKEILVDIVGKCCESGDIIRKDVMVPCIDENDIVIVYATGAYNYSMSSNYNHLLKPAVILVGEDVKILSRRETLDDLCKLF